MVIPQSSKLKPGVRFPCTAVLESSALNRSVKRGGSMGRPEAAPPPAATPSIAFGKATGGDRTPSLYRRRSRGWRRGNAASIPCSSVVSKCSANSGRFANLDCARMGMLILRASALRRKLGANKTAGFWGGFVYNKIINRICFSASPMKLY